MSPESPNQEPKEQKTNRGTSIILSRSQVLIAMAVTAVILFAISKGWTYVTGVAMVSLYWDTQHAAMGGGIGLGVALLSSLLYDLWESYRLAAQEYLEMVITPLVPLDLVWLGLLPGLSEEMLFRGAALPNLGMNGMAVIITSIVFGLLHMASVKYFSYAFWAIAVGMMLGAVTIYTDNLLTAIVAHTLTNSLSGVIWKWKHRSLAS